MNIAGLLALMTTGLTGMFLLSTWLGMGGHRAETSHPGRLPNALVFSHVGGAIVVFVLWVFFVVLHTSALAWSAAALVVVVGALGLGLFRRWVLQRSEKAPTRTAEHELPAAAVMIHGALAAATAVLVALAVVRP